MHSKLYSKAKKIKNEIIKFIKENYKVLLIYIILISIFVIPTKYEVYTPGSLLDVSKRVDVVGGRDTTGSLNITYVKSRGDSVGMVLISYIIPNWDLEEKSEITLPKETYDESEERYKLELQNANQTATMLAYSKAKKNIEITNTKVIVSYVLPKSNAKLNVGDEILEVDKQKIDKVTTLQEYLKTKKENDIVNIKLKRKKETKYIKAKLINIKNITSIGIYFQEHYILKTNPKVNIKYKKNESGSSAGLMTTLYIYNSLIDMDITKGLKVAGTGSINEEGKVIEIGGVKYKLMGAVKKKADVFIVPSENYNEALKLKTKKNYRIKLIKAYTLDQVIQSLQEI